MGFKGDIAAMVQKIRELAVSRECQPPFPEVEEVLKILMERGKHLHLLCNGVDYIPHILHNLGWDGWFDTVTFAQEVGVTKPDGRIFRVALERAKAERWTAIHVGDSLTEDVAGARGVELEVVWVNRGPPAPEFDGLTLADLCGLPDLLEP